MGGKRLKRELGLLQATMMGIGGAICAGVFVTLGYAATLAGTALIIATVLCGIINLFTMLSYAELGAAIPSAVASTLLLKWRSAVSYHSQLDGLNGLATYSMPHFQPWDLHT